MTHLRTERLPDEAIIISTYTDHINVADVASSMSIVSDYIRDIVVEIGSHLFMIIDVRETEATFKEMLDILRMPDEDVDALAPADLEVNMMMVGTQPMAKFYVQAVQQEQFGHQQIPLFADMDAALAAARTALSLHYSEASA